jgi:hypothetical protein
VFVSHSRADVTNSLTIPDTFGEYIKSKYGDEGKQMLKLYCVGGIKINSWHETMPTVFWKVSKDNEVLNGKVIGYDSIGKRIKERNKKRVTYAHSIDSNGGVLRSTGEKTRHCLFGEHLLKRPENENKTVAIVESEKTAVIASLHLPQYLWLSTGGDGALNELILLSVKNREIILFPDAGLANVKWVRKVRSIIHSSKGWNISVCNVLEKCLSEEERTSGWDIADLLVDDARKDALIESISNREYIEIIRQSETDRNDSSSTMTEVNGTTVFYSIDDKSNVKIRLDKFLHFLNHIGIRTAKDDNNGSKENYFFLLKNNVAKLFHDDDVRNYVNEYLRINNYSEEVRDAVNLAHKQLFNSSFIKQVMYQSVEYYQDSEECVCFFFKNGWIKILKGSTERPKLLDYSEMDFVIWDKQVIKRNYIEPKDSDTKKSYFQIFVEKVSGGGNEYQRFKDAHCYLLHNYKQMSKAFAVLCLDENPAKNDSERNGGTGKKIFLYESLKPFLSISFFGQEDWDMKRPFNLQDVSKGTRLIYLDELPIDFKPSDFLTIITNDVRIEVKQKSPIVLPFSQTPKVAMCSNFGYDFSKSSSYRRRFFILKFKHVYNDEYTPVDDKDLDAIECVVTTS